MASVAHLPFLLSFLHALPCQASELSTVVENIFSHPGACPGLVPTHLEVSLQVSLCPHSAPVWLAGPHVSILFASFISCQSFSQRHLPSVAFPHCVLHCGLAPLSRPWPLSPGWPSLGSRPLGIQGGLGFLVPMGLAEESSICTLQILILLKRIEKRNV